jgi:hypothetical protein
MIDDVEDMREARPGQRQTGHGGCGPNKLHARGGGRVASDDVGGGRRVMIPAAT